MPSPRASELYDLSACNCPQDKSTIIHNHSSSCRIWTSHKDFVPVGYQPNMLPPLVRSEPEHAPDAVPPFNGTEYDPFGFNATISKAQADLKVMREGPAADSGKPFGGAGIDHAWVDEIAEQVFGIKATIDQANAEIAKVTGLPEKYAVDPCPRLATVIDAFNLAQQVDTDYSAEAITLSALADNLDHDQIIALIPAEVAAELAEIKAEEDARRALYTVKIDKAGQFDGFGVTSAGFLPRNDLAADAALNEQNLLRPPSPLNTQVGGDHYKKMAIQPAEYNHANGIPFIEGCVIKYMTRWRSKGGINDLEKAKHFIDLLIELETKSNCKPEPTMRTDIPHQPV